MNIVINYYIFFKRNYFKIGTYFVFRLFLHQAQGLCQKEKRSFKRRMNLLFSCGWPLNSLRRIYEEKSYLFKERHFVVNLHTVNSVWQLPVFAADTSCKTKNPIIFTHGMAFTPSAAYPNSIPGIYEALTACGATVYTPATYAFAGTRDKANKFKEEFLKIQALYPAGQKFNIIGHSHGGLYTRDAITNLGLARYVASLTTVANPAQGFLYQSGGLESDQSYAGFNSRNYKT
jgi:hypothetical protein